MNKKEYMNNLLLLCTENQIDLFHRMYPVFTTNNQVVRATQQIESTLKKHNISREEFKKTISDQKTVIEGLEKALANSKNSILSLSEENKELQRFAERLKNPISLENNEVQEKLDLLYALQAGGVDNWEWYSESIEQYKKNQ